MDQNIQDQAKSMLKEIDEGLELEKALDLHATDLASAFTLNNTVRTTICNVDVILKYMRKDKDLILYVFDIYKLNMAREKYRPAVFQMKISQNFSLKENLKKLLLTMLYFEHDIVKPEEILEGEE